MTTLILRRRDNDAPSPAEAAGVVEALPAAQVVHCNERMLLVNVTDDALVDVLCSRLHGWVVSRQGPKIQVPDTRLSLGSEDE